MQLQRQEGRQLLVDCLPQKSAWHSKVKKASSNKAFPKVSSWRRGNITVLNVLKLGTEMMFFPNFSIKNCPVIFHHKNSIRTWVPFTVTLLWVDFSGYLALNYWFFWFTIKPLHKQCSSKTTPYLKNISLAIYLITVHKISFWLLYYPHYKKLKTSHHHLGDFRQMIKKER